MKNSQVILKQLLEENPALLADFGPIGSFKSLKDIPKESLELVYSKAMKLFEVGEYEQAKPLFMKLGIIKPEEFRFIHGMARCFFGQKDYQEALTLYNAYTARNPQSPEPHYYAALCYRELGQKTLELVGLKTCVSLTKDQPMYKSLYLKAETEFLALKYELEKEIRKQLSKE